MHRTGISIAIDRTIRDAAIIMEQLGIGALAVVDDDRLVGLVTDRIWCGVGWHVAFPAIRAVDG